VRGWRPPLLAVAVMLGSAAAPARADDVAWRDRLSLTASVRLRGEFVDWFAPPPGAAPAGAARYDFFASQVRLGARLTFAYAQVGVEAQDTRLANLPDDAVLPPPHGALGPGALYFLHTNDTTQGETFVRQAFVTVRRSGASATAGRFEYRDGLETVPVDPTLAALKRERIAERLIGPFGFTHVGRTFDGLRVVLDRAAWNLTAVGFRPTMGGFEVSANRELQDVSVAGLAATIHRLPGAPPLDARLFYFYYDDQRDDAVLVDTRPLAARVADRNAVAIHSGGGHAIAAIDAGPGIADLLLWGVVQDGDWGVLDHTAWAWSVEAGYQLPRVVAAPWLRVGVARSSGDDEPRDGEHGTFFQLLPTSRIYAQLPFYNAMNLEDVFTELVLRPHARVTLRTDWHWLRVTEPRDLWYSGGGATNDDVFGYAGIPTGGRRELAHVVDLSLTVVPHDRVTMGAYYGHAFGQGAVGSAFAGRDADYGFVELTVRY
jgi:hypothetical protein